MDRTWASGISLQALKVKRVLKGVQLQPSAPELGERQARLRENQSLNLFSRRKALKALVTLVRPREQGTKVGIRGPGTAEKRGSTKGLIPFATSSWFALRVLALERFVERVFAPPLARGY